MAPSSPKNTNNEANVELAAAPAPTGSLGAPFVPIAPNTATRRHAPADADTPATRLAERIYVEAMGTAIAYSQTAVTNSPGKMAKQAIRHAIAFAKERDAYHADPAAWLAKNGGNN